MCSLLSVAGHSLLQLKAASVTTVVRLYMSRSKTVLKSVGFTLPFSLAGMRTCTPEHLQQKGPQAFQEVPLLSLYAPFSTKAEAK